MIFFAPSAIEGVVGEGKWQLYTVSTYINQFAVYIFLLLSSAEGGRGIGLSMSILPSVRPKPLLSNHLTEFHETYI